MSLVLIAIAMMMLSGVPGLLLGRRSSAGQWVATAMCVAGAVVGLVGAGACLTDGSVQSWSPNWSMPVGRLELAVDALGAAFLLPIFVIAAVGSVYGMGYWPQRERPESGQRLRLFWGLMAGAMGVVVIARDGVVLLMAWEMMALAAYFLVVSEEGAQAREAGWVYLLAAHAGTLCLFAFFGLWRAATGSFALSPIAAGALAPGVATGLFVLALIGFGLKAGLIPLHFWLPGAHANAPSHVSAIMSGVLIKMGVYGLVRVVGLLPDPPIGWGVTLLIVGSVSGVGGIVLAMGQQDLKRLLAYSSVENVGIITIGVGLAVLGRTLEQPAWVALGLAGAVLHVWNHSLFKPLLFMSSGAVIHGVHSRQIDRMGGLAKRMPGTATAFLIGSAAICGLPPLNGFVGELLIYLGLLRAAGSQGTGWAWPALAAPVLALIGALALACFVKAFGAVFLGAPRSHEAAHAGEAGVSMRVPLGLLAGGCLAVGLLPLALGGALDQVVAAWAPAEPKISLAMLAPLRQVSVMSQSLLAILILGVLLAVQVLRRRPVRLGATWGCGYAAPTARMQYTGSSFTDTLARLFYWISWRRRRGPAVEGLFPSDAAFECDGPDPVLDRGLAPLFAAVSRLTRSLRVLQRGHTQAYLLYILLILLILLLWG